MATLEVLPWTSRGREKTTQYSRTVESFVFLGVIDVNINIIKDTVLYIISHMHTYIHDMI